MAAKISVLISTRNRYGKLMRTLESLWCSCMHNTKVVVVFDGDQMGCSQCRIDKPNVLALNVSHRGSVAARNVGMEFCEGSVLYATDDVVFPGLFIDKMRKEFSRLFPDSNGVMGIRQVQDHHKSGVALVGEAFLSNYPQRKLFCPEYYHFAAQEIAKFAELTGQFKIADETPALKHFHPAFFNDQIDQTHFDAREFSQQDHQLMMLRAEEGKVWPLA